jgi:hypothetical protein
MIMKRTNRRCYGNNYNKAEHSFEENTSISKNYATSDTTTDRFSNGDDRRSERFNPLQQLMDMIGKLGSKRSIN